jgi:hypothetical protein
MVRQATTRQISPHSGATGTDDLQGVVALMSPFLGDGAKELG